MTSDEKIAMLREKATDVVDHANGDFECDDGERGYLLHSDFIDALREALAATAPEQPSRHKWDRSGERCVKCGAKDWMGGSCDGRMPEQDGGWRSMEAEIELCARDLPKGAEVAVMVERGSAWVQASNWGNNHWDDSGYPDHSLAERIALARQWCIETEPPTRTEAEGEG